MVSIIVPAFNAEAFLTECLQSLVDQTLADIEILVIDDGSTDKTARICEQFASKYQCVRTFHTSNLGPSCARNLGIENAKGEWIAFVDADDTAHPAMAETLLRLAVDTQAEIAAFADGKSAKSEPIILSPREALKEMLYQRRFTCSAWGKLFRASLFKGVRFTPDLRYEDMDIMPRLLAQAKKIALAQSKGLYNYNSHAGSFLNVFSDKRLDVLKVTSALAKGLRHDKEMHRAALDRRFAANFNMFLLCSDARHPAAKECWETIKTLRKRTLFNNESRFRNRVGALLSFAGKTACITISKFAYP